MNKRALRADLLLLLTAVIWGLGFVAQHAGMRYIGPFGYSALRFLLGALFLLPFALVYKRAQRKADNETAAGEKPHTKKTLIVSSFLAGTCIFLAVSLQSLGMIFTTVGNAGFISSLYVIFTPIFGIFLNRKTGSATWVGAFLTLIGLFFLSFAGGHGSVNPGDILLAVGAVFWAFHVLVIDRLVKNTDPIALSAGQFFFAGLFSALAAFAIEPFLSSWLQNLEPGTLAAGLYSWIAFSTLISGLASGAIPFSLVSNAVIPVLYGGIVAGGIAYTFQLEAQRDAPPAHVTIILCLEGSFAALGGVLILGERVGAWTMLGFAFMLGGMLTSQRGVLAGRGTEEKKNSTDT